MDEHERQPADRYADLPEKTREFIEQLREKDVDLLNKAIEFMRSAETMGRFARFIAVLIVGSFLGMIAFGEGLKTFAGWFSKGPP